MNQSRLISHALLSVNSANIFLAECVRVRVCVCVHKPV